MYNPGQPRIPKRHHGGGRWTRGGYRPLSELGELPPPEPDADEPPQAPWGDESPADRYLPSDTDRMRPERGPRYAFHGPLRQLFSEAARRAGQTLAAGLALFEAWSSRNDSRRQAIATFRAREFVADENGLIILDDVRSLDRETVNNKLCKSLKNVEDLLEETLKKNPPKPGETNQEYGKRIHKEIENKIEGKNGKKDRKYNRMNAEVSLAVGQPDAVYGTAGSIRVDIIEYLPNGEVCVYDFKTGKTVLSGRRMQEIAETIFDAHRKEPKGPSKIWRITVTQVKRGQGKSPTDVQ